MMAIPYCRVSTDEQATNGVSLAAQQAKLEAYCQALDIGVLRVEVDAGFSASSMNRPGLQRALSSLRRGEAGVLLVTKLDRLTRSMRDLCELIDLFRDERRSLISLGESVDTRSAAGRLVLSLLTSVGQWEREACGERTSVAKRYQIAQGRYVGGRVPYGYALEGDGDGDRLVEVPSEQAAIVEARKLRASGLSLRAVAATLAERGILSRSGKRLTATTISAMCGGA